MGVGLARRVGADSDGTQCQAVSVSTALEGQFRMKYWHFRALVLLGACSTGVQAQSWNIQPLQIQSRWAALVSPENALPEYPRPQMVRSVWRNLNGLWQYAITSRDATAPPSYVGQILVPYPLESALSGVQKS